MTVTAAYLLMVILIAPALTTTGRGPIKCPSLCLLLCGHVFSHSSCLYGCLCRSLHRKGRYAQDGLSGHTLIHCRLYCSVYLCLSSCLASPGNIFEVLEAVVTAFIGIGLVAVAVEGYLFRPLNWLKRILLCGGGILTLIPGWKTDLLGLAIALPIVFWEWKFNRLVRKSEVAPY